jgi:hypothetical protein
MGSQAFKVSVDKVFFDTIRGKSGGLLGGEHDNDWATLTVTTIKDGHSRSWPGYQLASEISSGALVEDLQPPFEITDFVLDDDDAFLINLQIVNQASDGTLEKALWWSAGVIGALGSVLSFLGAVNKVGVAVLEGAVDGAIAGALAGLAALINKFLPKCDGLVFNRAYLRTVVQLMQDTQGEAGKAFTFPADPDIEQQSDPDCGGNPVTRVNLSITLTANNPDFGGLPSGSAGPPGPPVKIKSLSLAPGSAWNGQWKDAKSRIFCSIAGTEPTVSATGADGTTAVVKAAASSVTLPPLLTRLGTDPRNPPRDVARFSSSTEKQGPLDGPVFEAPPSAFTGAGGLAGGLTSGGGAGGLSPSEETVLAAIWRFSVNVTEVIPSFGESRNVATENDVAVAVPMVVISRTGDHYASPLISEEGALQRPVSGGVVFEAPPSAFTGAGGLAGGLTSGGGAGITNQIAPALTLPELGTTIPVSDNVFLQLYAAFDSQNRFVDYQIRYLRTGSGGEVVSDVMLTRPEVIH